MVNGVRRTTSAMPESSIRRTFPCREVGIRGLPFISRTYTMRRSILAGFRGSAALPGSVCRCSPIRSKSGGISACRAPIANVAGWFLQEIPLLSLLLISCRSVRDLGDHPGVPVSFTPNVVLPDQTQANPLSAPVLVVSLRIIKLNFLCEAVGAVQTGK